MSLFLLIQASRAIAAVPGLLSATLAVLGVGVGLAIGLWVVRGWRTYLLGRAPGDAAGSGVSLEILDRLGIASRPELEAMSPRERQFLLEVMAPRMSPSPDRRPVLRAEWVEPAEPRTGVFACPACGAGTVSTLAAPHQTTRCLGCRRRITLRTEMSGLVVEAEDDGPTSLG